MNVGLHFQETHTEFSFFYGGNFVVLTNGFQKKTQKTVIQS